MARKRTKVYKSGDRIQVSLNQGLSSDFLNWINKQSDLTNFFLYSAKELYKKTGDIDVYNIMPRNIDIDTIKKKVVEVTNQESMVSESNDETWQKIESNSEMYQEKETIDESDKTESKPWEALEQTSFESDNFS